MGEERACVRNRQIDDSRHRRENREYPENSTSHNNEFRSAINWWNHSQSGCECGGFGDCSIDLDTLLRPRKVGHGAPLRSTKTEFPGAARIPAEMFQLQSHERPSS